MLADNRERLPGQASGYRLTAISNIQTFSVTANRGPRGTTSELKESDVENQAERARLIPAAAIAKKTGVVAQPQRKVAIPEKQTALEFPNGNA